MKYLMLLTLALTCFANYAHAETSTTPSLVDYLDRLTDKFDNYLDERAVQRRQLERARARIVPKGAKPEVTIRRTGISSSKDPYFADGILYNGQSITITDPPSRAIEVLGPNFRIHQGHHIWDNLGISVNIDTPSQSFNNEPEPDYIASITIELNPPPPGEPASPAEPAHYFSGYLDLDGASIDSETTIWEVRALVDRSGLAGGHPYIFCRQSETSCQVQTYGDERTDYVSFWTDKDHANGKIYSVTYSFENHSQLTLEQNKAKISLGYRSDSEEAMLILLEEHHDPRWKDRLETLLKARDERSAVLGHQ